MKNKNKISFLQLFKLASKQDVYLIVIGTLSAIVNGMMQPLFGQLFGEMSQTFSPENSPDQIFDGSIKIACYFVLVGGREQQALKIRLSYYESMIKQDIGYFDSINANEISSKVTMNCYKIQQAIGEKICMNLYTFSQLIGCLIIAFLRGWQIALVSSIIIPIVWYSCKFLTWVSNGVVRKTSQAYQEAGGIAEQALSSIRTVKSLGGEQFESQKFNNLMSKAFNVSLKYSIFTGVAYGLQNMMLFFDFSLTFWVGSLFIEHDVTNQNQNRTYNISDIIVVFLTIVLTSFRLGGATDSIKYFEEAQIAGFEIFEILNRIPAINQDTQSLEAQKVLKNCKIQFRNIRFSYPQRKEINILDALNLEVQPMKKTAIVGKSGCGKSTIIQLLARFYDPTEGTILIDGIDIKQFQLHSLRQVIGYVSQEPVLFSTTIRENLKYAKPDASEEEMIEALQKANVWSFIEQQEKKLDTYVGQNGTQLSGGQKQRICIARAILKKPKILLLDEATSALDSKSEALVQSTLDEVALGITTIIVAHRLSTIQSADEIIVIDNGQVVERGTHDQLMNIKGSYFELVKKQEEINDQNKITSDKNIKLEIKDCLNEVSDQRKEEYLQVNNIFTVQSLSTLKQLSSIENDLQNEKTSKQLITLPTENLITEMNTEECEFNKKSNLNTQLSSKRSLAGRELKEELIEENKSEYKFGYILKKLLTYNKDQIVNALLGMFFSIGTGIAYPLCGWVFGNIASILLNPNVENFREESNKYSLFFALIGVLDLVSLTLQYLFSSKIAENLTYSLRCDLFKKFISMPISWFDQPQNNSGILASQLQIDCKQVNVLVGTTITFNVANICSLVCAIILGLTADWRTTLVGLVLMPLIILSSIFYVIKINIFSSNMNQSSEESAQIISESSVHIRTVASLGNPNYFCDQFRCVLTKNVSSMKKSAFSAGMAIGLYNFALFGVYGIIFLCGAAFHKAYEVDIRDILVSILCLMLAALGIGKNTEFMGDAGASILSANRIFKNLESSDEQQQQFASIFRPEQINGEIIFDDVSFKYPSRDAYVIQNVSFKIPARKRVAFVGLSGSGKSTIIQLIQRFYEGYSGRILLDGVDIKKYNLSQYRNYFGVVQQEPVLFNGTIKDNIVYNTQNACEKDIKEVSQIANAFTFINAFSEGFSKQVGVRGTQMSGGQKQRIAISRMILKKPQIMLLDEATSALDYLNEHEVQESLNKSMSGKTAISVAHRISTIQDSDIIFVLENGQIVEQGDYQTLLENQNVFYKLTQVKQQS